MTVVTKSSAAKGRAPKDPAQQDPLIQEQFLAADLDEMAELEEKSRKTPFKTVVVWRNVAIFVALHLGAALGLYQLLFEAKWMTVLWTAVMWVLTGFGITAGAHRLWAHKSYKARLPARIFLMLCQTAAFQNDIIEWARDHRCHHKWTDTDADPHNTRRGFFFAHMGWLLAKKHPQVKEQGSKLDLADLYADPVCAFQRKYYLPMVAIWCFLFPTMVAVIGWGESAFVGLYTAAIFRYCWTLHATWFINSWSHYFGYRPYDVNITPTESLWTNVLAVGEGGHNFHHTFPQDYRTSEYPHSLNWTRTLIDVLAAVGWVYDRKTVADEIIKRQVNERGDPKARVY